MTPQVPVRHILMGKIVIFVALQSGELHPLDLLVTLQIFRHGLGVGAVLLHAEGQTFQPQIQQERALGGLDAAKVPHQLGGTLGDERAAETEALGVGDAVVAVVRGTQAGELVRVGRPVELAAVHDGTAQSGGRDRPCIWWWSG